MNILLSQLKEMNLEGMHQALSRLQESGDAQASNSLPVLSRLIEAEAEYRRDKKSQSLAKRARFRYHARGCLNRRSSRCLVQVTQAKLGKVVTESLRGRSVHLPEVPGDNGSGRSN